MDDWREVEAKWEGVLSFTGSDSKRHQVSMGATESGFSPMELILLGLAGCTGTDVVQILKKKRQPLDGLKIKVRGLRRAEAPRIYTDIELEYIFWGDGLDTRALEKAISLSQNKYCSAYAMLKETAKLRTRITVLSSQFME